MEDAKTEPGCVMIERGEIINIQHNLGCEIIGFGGWIGGGVLCPHLINNNNNNKDGVLGMNIKILWESSCFWVHFFFSRETKKERKKGRFGLWPFCGQRGKTFVTKRGRRKGGILRQYRKKWKFGC